MGKIEIWGNRIPGNSERNKLDDMKVKGKPFWIFQMFRMFKALTAEVTEHSQQVIDTFTYVAGIKRGFEKETYEDIPYLIPFLVDGSKEAVIVIPGGAYCYKQTDLDGEGKQGEGDLVAKELNKAGISAFVLWYRSNPYRMPIPLLDVQRAIRYLRYHGENFGVHKDKISIMGFSAGGYQVAGFLNNVRGRNKFPAAYIQDEIDRCSDSVTHAALIYPCLEFSKYQAILGIMYSYERIFDSKEREKIIMESDCIQNFESADIPQFIAYGTHDALIDPRQSQMYATKLKETGADYMILAVEGAGHGFGAKPGQIKKFGNWIEKYTLWAQKFN